MRLLISSRGAAILLAAGLLTLIAAVFVIGIGAALLLAGTWVLSTGTSRLLPQRSAAAAWAIALICELSIVLSLSAVAAWISPHPQPPIINLGILLAPVLVGVVLIVIAIRSQRGAAGASLFFDRIAVMIAASVVLGVAALRSRGASYDIAWAMSGDARNHLLIVRASLFNGGLTVEQIRSYPAAFNAVAALVAGSTPRSPLSSGDLMLHDMRALAGVYLVLVIALACMIVAALASFISRRTSTQGASAVSMSLLLMVAASASASASVLGTALRDGSFSAYGGLAISLASVVIAMSALASRSRGPLIFAFLAPAIVLLFVSWTILAVIPVALAVAVIATFIVRSRRRNAPSAQGGARAGQLLLLALPLLAAAGIAAVTLVNLARLEASFRLTGSIASPNIWLLPIIALVLVGIAIVVPGIDRTLVIAMLVAVLIGVVTVVWLAHLPAGWRELTATYYSQKTLWLVAATLVWVPFLPLVLVADRVTARARAIPVAVALSVASLAVVLGLSAATSVSQPVMQAVAGWQEPTARTITTVAKEADIHPSFVLWDYSPTGDDRLGNFWAALAWTTTESGQYKKTPAPLSGGLAYWAYFETGQQVQQLCPLVADYPAITVVTRSSDVPAELRQTCGASSYNVDVVTSPSG